MRTKKSKLRIQMTHEQAEAFEQLKRRFPGTKGRLVLALVNLYLKHRGD
jgi:hypothetical protein